MDQGLTALGYVGVHSAKPDEWAAYATRFLGMPAVDQAGSVRAFRMGDRKQRLVVTGGVGEGLAFLGWEVSSVSALDALAARLEGHGVKVSARRVPWPMSVMSPTSSYSMPPRAIGWRRSTGLRSPATPSGRAARSPVSDGTAWARANAQRGTRPRQGI
jgi:hypothetical protein